MVNSDILNLLSFGVLLYFCFKIFNILKRILYPYVIASPIDLKKASGGDWAVVTGSTDGIGKQYAIELSKKNFNIILISRNQSKLEDVKNEIHQISPNVEIKTISFDFTNTSYNDYESVILKELKNYEIGIFVNNVGMAFEIPAIIHETEGGLKRISDILIVNSLPVTILTAEIIPQMLKRNKGIIVNVASFVGYLSLAEWNVYSASKRYMIHLTRILQKEYYGTGIIFQCLCPLLIVTKMSKAEKTSIFSPYPDEYVKSAIKTIGRAEETSGYLPHQLQTEGINLLPSIISDFFTKRGNDEIKSYMKKQIVE
ncbi:Estradiol 17-beta-dehydrogenase 12 [Strongyloides ratti]|uniref:Estradiol 17-beta-dehydrogenase 12 n=1 Tax=Strongyloides ratti TaxID=34506 RepID=A0A090LNY4_STRRB|nr:Estradiol 17-beta-dehydrogenase 12 [Strongyloides ratti]CEF69899.1 Estradiol 17-beta-dehydrogenase 12 [Strongyloides ratti]